MKTLASWSSGKDSAWIVHVLRARGDVQIGALLTCIDPRVLDRRFVGRDFDAALLAELPPAVDTCGEHGEFHTFAHRGPMFDRTLEVDLGTVVERDGLVFADLDLLRAEVAADDVVTERAP